LEAVIYPEFGNGPLPIGNEDHEWICYSFGLFLNVSVNCVEGVLLTY